MRILAIDYGRKKVGLALATSKIAAPHSVITFFTKKELIEKLRKVIKEEEVDQIVVGISEGEMALETKNFGEGLKKEFGLDIFYQDETLTTSDAQRLSRQAGIKRKKRRSLEDAYSAALILQAQIDSQ